MNAVQTVVRKPRKFIPENFIVENWNQIAPYYHQLISRTIHSVNELEQWMLDRSELESAIDEDARWRYIKMTSDLNNVDVRKSHEFFITEIQPHLIEVKEQLNKKIITCEFTTQLDKNIYGTLLKVIDNSLKLHEDENIELLTAIELLQNEYQEITGNLTIQYKNEEYTLPQAIKFLTENDRTVREEVYHLIQQRRLKETDKLNELFTKLVNKRNEVATKVGFENYRDYKFIELNRNDYNANDCFNFHEAIKTEILPLYTKLLEDKKNALGIDTLRPWDIEMPDNGTPLIPFVDGEDLTQKTIQCFYKLHPFFGDCIATMKAMGHLDLESRKGKAPGGYNMGLPEIGVPFIFMNAASSVGDMITMLHEGGHAIHSFLAKDLKLKDLKDVPSEIAEVASMSMELISMEHWDIFFTSENDIIRAKRQQLKRVISILPWVAVIDKFQHWIYTHPNHTIDERKNEWVKIFNEFTPKTIDFTGLEDYVNYRWQSQLHIYEVPFYYIEYAIAQLGAVAMWKQYKENGQKALENYMAALKLGYSKSLPELYKAGGIEFNFSQKYIAELVQFLKAEYEALH